MHVDGKVYFHALRLFLAEFLSQKWLIFVFKMFNFTSLMTEISKNNEFHDTCL